LIGAAPTATDTHESRDQDGLYRSLAQRGAKPHPRRQTWLANSCLGANTLAVGMPQDEDYPPSLRSQNHRRSTALPNRVAILDHCSALSSRSEVSRRRIRPSLHVRVI
jgi:hypothetical protein